jgi:Nuclease-related domain
MIGYAEVVDQMAWPKLKRPRSSAPSVAHEHNGVRVTVAPMVDAEKKGTERDHGTSPVNGVSRTMLDGFVPGASVTAVSSDTPATVNQYDAGSVPDDPGELGIDALLGPRAPAGGQAPESPDAAAPITDQPGQAAGPEPASAAPATGAEAPGQADDASQAGQEAAVSEAPPGDVEPGDQAPPRRERLRDLASDSRMRIWRRRILLTVIAGAVFSVIFTWRLGLTIAVIVAVADTIYRSWTVASVPPGVKVTPAQRQTQRQLARMERSGYRSLHSRPIPGSEEFIDHLVVGPTGVYAIDSEKWDRRLPIRTRNARQLWHGPESKKDRLEHAKWEAERASTLLSGNLNMDITVRPTMAIYGPKIPWDVAVIRDVDVFGGPRLRKYLRKRGKMSKERLSDAEIEKIHRAAMTVLPL